MVKNDNKRYIVGEHKVDLKKLYSLASPVISSRKRTTVLRSIQTHLVPHIPVLIVFVRHRSKKNEWLALLSTDCTISEEEIIRIYGMRWDIEVFFKCAKSMLRLQKEFQGRSYDMMISHTTIVFTRYIVLAWQHRLSTDARSFGGMFHAMCDEVKELDWAVALTTLVELVEQIAKSQENASQLGFKRNSYNGLTVYPAISRLIYRFQCAKVELLTKKDARISVSNLNIALVQMLLAHGWE